MSERETLKAKKADKERRLDDILRPRINSLLAEVRRHLGGQYVEGLDDLKIPEAEAAFGRLKQAYHEARQLQRQIDHLHDLLHS